jgi:hypothetical protein
MHPSPTYTVWKIACRSSYEVQALKQWLSGRIDLDRNWTDTVRVIPNGEEADQTVHHRLGDYFAAICTLPDLQGDPASFRLVFRKRPEAGRYWKDLMVNILRELETVPQTASIEIDSKGELEPAGRELKG